jgi:glycolate oxidase FAD binding subunit
LDVREHSGVVSYEPSELVVTARCGTPLQVLETLLAQEGQCLAFCRRLANTLLENGNSHL